MSITAEKPQRSARKAKGDGHLRRAEILEAAERIFLAEGYHGATIRKIADEVGVSSTALYMHFADKDQILLEICEGAIRRLLEANEAVASQPLDPVSRIRLMAEGYVRFALTNPNAYQLVFCSPTQAVAEDKQAAMMALGQACFDKFLGVVREIEGEGRLRFGTAESAAQVMWAACHGVVALLITRPTFPWEAPEELQKVLGEGLLYGLLTD
ncbi:MAG TPA: TetR/AcrR family transcriptional regulator [Caulobacteraceae bacterium]|nr:TetR/AcrR family transcriptional regulator [Caulobacteraceae bacterium]